jgi:hypothetical protein
MVAARGSDAEPLREDYSKVKNPRVERIKTVPKSSELASAEARISRPKMHIGVQGPVYPTCVADAAGRTGAERSESRLA